MLFTPWVSGAICFDYKVVVQAFQYDLIFLVNFTCIDTHLASMAYIQIGRIRI